MAAMRPVFDELIAKAVDQQTPDGDIPLCFSLPQYAALRNQVAVAQDVATPDR